MKTNSLLVVVALLSVACQNGDKSAETARESADHPPRVTRFSSASWRSGFEPGWSSEVNRAGWIPFNLFVI